MNPIVKKDILNVLRETVSVIKKGEYHRLKDISDKVIHNATIFQDTSTITIAVVVYSLSKVYSDYEKTDPALCARFEKGIGFLEKGKMNEYDSEIKGIIGDFSKKDEKTRLYIQEVLERAEIKKASNMYEHGISLGQVAEAIGISIWDLMEYVGQTRIVDSFEIKTDVKGKLALTRSLFK